jgi:hypothetical protein
MTAQYVLKCLIPESNPRALPLWMSTLPESGCKDNKKSRLCKRTTAYILYLVRCIFLSHRLFPKLRPSEDSLFCCFWSGRRGSNSRPTSNYISIIYPVYRRTLVANVHVLSKSCKLKAKQKPSENTLRRFYMNIRIVVWLSSPNLPYL